MSFMNRNNESREGPVLNIRAFSWLGLACGGESWDGMYMYINGTHAAPVEMPAKWKGSIYGRLLLHVICAFFFSLYLFV